MFITTAAPCNEDLKPKFDRLAKRPVPIKPAWKDNIYIYDKEENFDVYMKNIGIGKVLRRMGRELQPIAKLVFHEDDGEYTFSILANYLNYEAKFELGEPFKDETFDGRFVVSTFTLEKDVLTQVEENECGVKSTIIREFTPSVLKTTLIHGDLTATRYYNSIIKIDIAKVIEPETPLPFRCPPMETPTLKDAVTILEADETKEDDDKEKLDEDEMVEDESGESDDESEQE